jgi:hypothetical protein
MVEPGAGKTVGTVGTLGADMGYLCMLEMLPQKNSEKIRRQPAVFVDHTSIFSQEKNTSSSSV